MNENWTVYIYRLKEAPKGFQRAWADSHLVWNGERAGLVSLPNPEALEFPITRVCDLGDNDRVSEDFNGYTKVIH